MSNRSCKTAHRQPPPRRERRGPCSTIERRETRKRDTHCKHSNAYLTFALDKSTQIRRSLSCRNCNMIIILPSYMVILNDHPSEYVRIEG